jgi:hypothetical protein
MVEDDSAAAALARWGGHPTITYHYLVYCGILYGQRTGQRANAIMEVDLRPSLRLDVPCPAL